MPTAEEQLAGEIKAKNARIHKFFTDTKQADGTYDLDQAQLDEIKALRVEVDAEMPKLETMRENARMAREAGEAAKMFDAAHNPAPFGGDGGNDDGVYFDRRGRAMRGNAMKGLGTHFTESAAYKDWMKSNGPAVGGGGRKITTPRFDAFADVELKTVFSTTAGWDPFVTRLPGVVLSPQQMPKVVDLIPSDETTQHSIKYMLETTYTDSADATAEGGAYPESAFALTETVVPVQKISHFIPVTDEQLADEPQARGYLNGRMEFGLRQKLDNELINGSGTSPHMRGLLNWSGISTQAQGADSTPDAVYKAMVKILTAGFTDASGIIMHPVDWQNVRLLKTSIGSYIYGSPDMDGPARMWGLPVVATTYMGQGTAIVADFVNFVRLFWRKGIDFRVSDSHSNFFVLGQLAVRADVRAAHVVSRVTAICTVTGVAAS